ncbi:hypothetical protein BJ165DRAFT_1402583 [Panaeolus papilionaceus]|nr:hypothetical protein BJ165DRAFT_1402583 [Panaeolus papilionaceus]
MAENFDVSLATTTNNSGDMLQLPSTQVGSIEDILSSICQNFIHDTFEIHDAQQRQNRTTLLRATQAFRMMLEPALNALWHTIPSIEPLIRLLDCVTLEGNEYRLSCSHVDWTRFDHHARRVRSVHIPDRSIYAPVERERVPASLIHFLDRTRQPLISPGVISLYIPSGGCAHNAALPFISSSLKTLKIGTKHHLSFFLILMHLVQRECPHLQELAILDADSNLILDFVGKIKALKRLELQVSDIPLSAKFLTTLAATSQKLDHLSITSSSKFSSPAETGRPRLKVSTIHFTGPIFQVLDFISPIHLKEITVDYVNNAKRRTATDETWEYLVARISGLQQLTSLVIDYRTSFSTTDLSTLSGMPSLRKLSFGKNTTATALTNASVNILTAALPNLQWLALPRLSARGQRPTLEVIYDITRNCPQLESLLIHIDTLSSMAPPPIPITGSIHPLRNLWISEDLNNSTPFKFSSLVPVTGRLLDCFPDLRFVEASETQENTKEKCNLIMALLALLREREAFARGVL